MSSFCTNCGVLLSANATVCSNGHPVPSYHPAIRSSSLYQSPPHFCQTCGLLHSSIAIVCASGHLVQASSNLVGGNGPTARPPSSYPLPLQSSQVAQPPQAQSASTNVVPAQSLRVESVEIFFCYAREDEELRQGLEKQLRALRRQGLINMWHDHNISAGTEWERDIDKHLNAAQIILLLVSPDFMDSDYCYGIEMKRAMERHEQGEAQVIPIILRPVYWQRAPFGKLQALPTDGTPVKSSKWHNLDEAFFDIAEGIRNAVENLVSE